MAEASPARLYATGAGAALVVFGIVGFFYSASFGSPGEVDEVFGAFAVNGWHNVLYILTGALGLLVAGFAPRRYALCLGVAYVALAIWGFVLGDGESILGFFPINTADSLLHAAIGALGVLAALATPKSPRRPATPKS